MMIPRRESRLAAVGVCALLAVTAACHKQESAPLYEDVPVERRTITVSASAAGVIEPVRTIDVKSKASGEIIELNVETGEEVKSGQLLAVVDARQPKNTLLQAEADLNVAKAQLEIANSKLARADTLVNSQAITESDYEDARLSSVAASAQVVRAKTDLQNARDQMDDTRVRAPAEGTVIAKSVELGTVISSPTKDVGGGTVLLRMANLDTVQIRTLVDETDIGKVRPGLEATITVDAYPNRPFDGAVLKIEPQATVVQNVTMFPALVRIANPRHLLMPGMNAEVEIHIGTADDVLAIPYAALRTPRDVASAAAVLGLDPATVEAELERAAQAPAADSSKTGHDSTQARAVARPSRGGGKWRGQRGAGGAQGGGAGPGGGGLRAGGGPGFRGGGGGGRYIVFAIRDGAPVPVEVQTGLTDLDYVEVVSGLSEGDRVVLLPSASLVNSQREMRERIQRMTGGGGIPGMQQQQQSGSGQSRPPQR